jgi:mycothiol synthase
VNVEILRSKTLPLFLEYCSRNEKAHDESYLSAGELKKFTIKDNITFILTDSENENSIKGVFSIMLNRKRRVRIYHVEEGNSDEYLLLHKAMINELKKSEEVCSYSMFITEPGNESIIEILNDLGLNLLRFIFVLERELSPVETAIMPEGYTLNSMNFPDDAAVWAEIRNLSMKNLLGYKYYGKDFFLNMNKEEEYLNECTLILRHGDKAVGIIKAEQDDQENGIFGFIGPIAVLPDYQGKGLGRYMLRHTVNILTEKYNWPSSLCVNAENEDALKLYLQEGFRKTEIVREMSYSNY